MHFAIYGRKSVYSDKSDSISNQLKMCREYIDIKFHRQVESITEYTDDGLTGANTNRPQLKALLTDITDGLLDALVVYQLDRLSRDVKDFSNIYATLEEHHIMFISLKENIDTTTPIGKAMMYTTMVFAQMERETIATRITDNMIGLAKKGLWTGGNPPVGYIRKQIEIGGKKHVTIVPDPETINWVKWIFDTFLQNNYSLQNMETTFRRQGIKTLNGAFFSTTQLHKILTMPYCVEATAEVYDYYSDLGCKMDIDSPREKWDGKHGVMIYGRSTEKYKRHTVQPKSEWIVCIGLHEPFISAKKWLAVQNRFQQNIFDKKKKYDVPLLKGKLYCAKCKCRMQVARKKEKNGVYSSYYCITRLRKGKETCDMSSVSCQKLDKKILDIFKEITMNPSSITQYAVEPNCEQKSEWRNFDSEITSYKTKINRLTTLLADVENSTAAKHIVEEIEKLDANIGALQREKEMQRVQQRRTTNNQKSIEQKAADIGNLIRGLSCFTADEQNEIVKSVIKELTWDGETLFIRL